MQLLTLDNWTFDLEGRARLLGRFTGEGIADPNKPPGKVGLCIVVGLYEFQGTQTLFAVGPHGELYYQDAGLEFHRHHCEWAVSAGFPHDFNKLLQVTKWATEQAIFIETALGKQAEADAENLDVPNSQ